MPENSSNDEEKLVIRTYKLAYSYFVIVCLVFILLGIFMISTPPPSTNISNGGVVLAIATLFLIFSMMIFFSDAGNIVLSKGGFTLYRPFRKPFFIAWSEVNGFYGGLNMNSGPYLRWDKATSKKMPGEIDGFYYPIKSSTLAGLMNNWKKHYETGEPLKDYPSYPKPSLFGILGINQSLSLIFFCCLIIIEIILLIYPFKMFTFDNQSNMTIQNIEVTGVSQKTRSVQYINFLYQGKSEKIKLDGFRNGLIFIRFESYGHRQCRTFKNPCGWNEDDKFIFEVDGTITPIAKFDQSCQYKYIEQAQCEPDS